ncbi:MAG: tRNA (guanosine(37)-N1)-methyltransferase TrmD [Candidatus Sericytochromatia bacterium]
MKLEICTLFPGFFESPLQTSILGRAVKSELLTVRCHDIRAFSTDKHRTVDDRPFGGGPGMVLKPDPVFACVESLELEPGTPIIVTTPRAPLFTQADAIDLSAFSRLVFLCGHYEGIDERVHEQLCTHAYSIGSYVLTGGELASLVMIDAIVRLIPGVVGKMDSVEQDSFMEGLLDCPHYTRPADFRGQKVPDVLMGGNHAEIERWRRQQQLLATRKWRPDLFATHELSESERKMLEE